MSEFGFGTLVTNLSNYMGTGHSVRQQERDEQMADYKQREREGIQARVEGAKAAGIHPLVAMGFQAGPGPSTVVGGVREASHMGMDNLGEEPSPQPNSVPAAPTVSETDTRIAEATARRTEAEAELAEINAHNAMRALASQPGQPIGMLSGEPNPSALTSGLNLIPGKKPKTSLKPGIKLKPDEVTMGKGGLTAGTHQAGTTIELPNGETWNIPSSLASEGLEDLDLAKYYLMWQMNRNQILESLQNAPGEAYRSWENHSRRVGDYWRDKFKSWTR